jgi:folate-binding protein YgfZ
MVSPTWSDSYRAARDHAALIDRSDRGRILMTGRDRGSYLQGLLTNDIAALEEGEGCYAAYLTPQGRMIADLLVYELGDAMLLSMVGLVKGLLLTRFEELVFAEDVKVSDWTDTFCELTIVGPEAAGIVAAIAGLDRQTLERMAGHACRRVEVASEPGVVARVTDLGVPGFDLCATLGRREQLHAEIRAAGAIDLAAEAAEALRIEAGVPLFGRDMDDATIPLEAGIEDRAISFTKGCYVGQEVVVRILHRGHGRVARRLVGLELRRDGVSPGTVIRHDGDDVGRVTSCAWSPLLDAPVALGYVERAFTEPGATVSAGGVEAVVTALPIPGAV